MCFTECNCNQKRLRCSSWSCYSIMSRLRHWQQLLWSLSARILFTVIL